MVLARQRWRVLPSPAMGEVVEINECGCCGSSAWEPAGAAQGVELRRCTGCGTLRFSSVSPPEVVYADGYHDGSATYGWDWTDPGTVAYEQALNDRRVAWLERHVPRGSIVDVGGGLGFFTAAAAGRGWDATLLEPVASAARFAEQSFGVKAVNAGIDHLASPDRVYDVVALLHVLEHIPRARDALVSIRSAIAPGGVLVIELPNHASLSRRLQGDRWMGWQAGEHVHLFTPATLRALLGRSGYEIVHAGTFVPLWEGLLPDSNAHFLGLETALQRALAWRRRHKVSDGRRTAAPFRPSVPATELRGIRRAVYGSGFSLLAKAEERTGLGTNVRVLARPLVDR